MNEMEYNVAKGKRAEVLLDTSGREPKHLRVTGIPDGFPPYRTKHAPMHLRGGSGTTIEAYELDMLLDAIVGE
jgi:hypothetical protein